MTPTEPKPKKPNDSTPGNASDSSWEHDQKSKDYYYDDTCGYAVFENDTDERGADEEDDLLTGEN